MRLWLRVHGPYYQWYLTDGADGGTNCKSKECHKQRRKLKLGDDRQLPSDELYPDPLASLRDMRRAVDTATLCHACEDNFIIALDREMRELWEDLPNIFDIERLLKGA